MLIALGEKTASPLARCNGVLELLCVWCCRVFIEQIHPRLVANSGLVRGIQSLDEVTHSCLFPQWLLIDQILFMKFKKFTWKGVGGPINRRWARGTGPFSRSVLVF